jgi:hypothetical protein
MKEEIYKMNDLATRIVLHYFQNWGQPLQERIDTLNEAVTFVGIKAKFIQNERGASWSSDDEKESQRAKEFRMNLNKCFPQGQFELEVKVVEGILQEYKAKTERLRPQ